MDRKYFFFDIDGTLAAGEPGNRYIPESTKKAVEELKKPDTSSLLPQAEAMPWPLTI